MANYKDIRYNFALPSNAEVGSMTLIKEQTASSSATISFVHGTSDVVLDSTYPIYLFKFINIHPSAASEFFFNLSTDGGSNYNVTKTTTAFTAGHNEADSDAYVVYNTSRDLAQGTGFQQLTANIGDGADECGSGYLHLFNPSSTTFVKHFISRTNYYEQSDYSNEHYIAGYGNTTSAIDAVQFKFGSGNIDSGTIKLYGIKN